MPKGKGKPAREPRGIRTEFAFHFEHGSPTPVRDFPGIRIGLLSGCTDEDMVEFVLDEAFTDIDAVYERIQWFQRALDSHFFPEPTRGCRQD